jgi:aldehyde:ferredoxin oxidoreductase
VKVRDNAQQRVLRVDLSTRTIEVEDLPRDWTGKYLGARGVTSRLLYSEVKPGIDPYGPENVLYIGSGPLDGLPVGMGRLSIATKSPRRCIGEGSVGGFLGPELRRAGYEYIAVRGCSDKPVYLYIEDENVEILDAGHLWGKTTYQTDDLLREQLPDPDTQFLYIGPAGENLVHAAMVFSGRDSTGGRAGGGEVMGAKKLKAIAVRGHGGIKPHDYDAFLDAYKGFRHLLNLRTSRDMWTPVWSTFGAPVLSRLFPDLGNLMTNNAKIMSWDSDKAAAISSEYFMNDYGTRAQSCFNCPWPACKKNFRIDKGGTCRVQGRQLLGWSTGCPGLGNRQRRPGSERNRGERMKKLELRYVAAVYPITNKLSEIFETEAGTLRELIRELDDVYGGFAEMFLDSKTGGLTLNTMIYYGAKGSVPKGVLDADLSIADQAAITFW